MLGPLVLKLLTCADCLTHQDPAAFDLAQKICVEMGQYFQVRESQWESACQCGLGWGMCELVVAGCCMEGSLGGGCTKQETEGGRFRVYSRPHSHPSHPYNYASTHPHCCCMFPLSTPPPLAISLPAIDLCFGSVPVSPASPWWVRQCRSVGIPPPHSQSCGTGARISVGWSGYFLQLPAVASAPFRFRTTTWTATGTRR